jgi:hypothetical protein
MRTIVPSPLGWQSSLPIQITRSPNASLRAIAVFMMMPLIAKEGRSIGDASGTAQPIPLWRLRSGPRSSPIDQCSDIAPRTSARLQRLAFHQVPFLTTPRALRGLSPSLNVQVSYEIANNLYLLDIVVRDFYASELVLNRQHQLNAIEQIGSEIVREMRLARDKVHINAELLGDESAHIVD